MHRLVSILIGLSFISAASAAQTDAIVARVNSEVIMLSQMRDAALDQDVPIQDLMSDGLKGAGFRRVLTALVDEALLVQRATKDEIKPDDVTIASNVDRMIKELDRQLGSHEALEAFLKDHSLSFEEFREMLTRRERRRTMATEVVARRVKTDAATIAEFEKKCVAENKPTELVRLAQILIAVPGGDRENAAAATAYKKAVSIARKAGSNPARFPALARESSDDAATRQVGGDLGWLDPRSMRPELKQAAKGLQSGDVSEPVWANGGWHIVQLVDRRDVRDIYFAEAFAKERARLIEQLRAEATIKIYDLQ